MDVEANKAKQIINDNNNDCAKVNSNSTIDDSIPHSSLSVDTALPFPLMSPRIIELCKDLFRKWAKLDDSCFSVETVSGGITNLLLKVSVKEESGDNVAVTVRLYGPNTEYVIDRERELQAIKYLSAAGFGAKLLGVFGNGMVQSFINARTLTPLDMRKPKLAAEIAKQLCRFHQVEIPGPKEPQLWVDMFKFFEKASALRFEDPDKQRIYETILFKEVHKEATQLKELTELFSGPVVFAHNDLLSGNLMLNDEQDKLYIIDFEYGSYNYRGFDIGNHFNEYAGYECDYSLYPSKEEQYHFLRHYLQPEKPYEVSEKDLEDLYVEANTFRQGYLRLILIILVISSGGTTNTRSRRRSASPLHSLTYPDLEQYKIVSLHANNKNSVCHGFVE
ncbi:probable ethanolamine kinase isoform X1 [Gossypium arboreum]|uniref:probable ethanolamine kinase isoform X1 n=1 Tax=Gossypium arboreum TaxID=29729 RepID=UPI0022F1CA3B|nr:probable ethanolamine kinase isoform X1 [Gossypium arboreum]